MVDFSWNEWLRGKNLGKKRVRRVARAGQIETLEQRTLLTAPVGVADTYDDLMEDTPYVSQVSVLDNDTDADLDTLTATLMSQPASGATVTLNPDGSFSYTPVANFNGTDTFVYTASDGTDSSDPVTVTLTIGAVADLTVEPSSFTVAEDSTLNDTVASDSTTSGGTLTYAVSGQAPAGQLTLNPDGSFEYIPNSDSNGTVTFDVAITDATAAETSTKTVSIVITPVADLTVTDAAFTGNEDTDIVDSLADGDATTSNGGALAYALNTAPTGGTVVVNPDGTFTYTPNANFNGSDSFTVDVTDAIAGETLTKSVDLTIEAVADITPSVDAFYTPEDTLFEGSVATNDLTTSGGLLTYAVGTPPALGTLIINADGSLTYEPEAGYIGTQMFTYVVTDADAEESVTVSAAIRVGNNLPEANPAAESTNKNVTLTGTLTATDDDSDTLTFALGATTPENGVVTVNPDGTYTYIPDAGFSGQDSFSFFVNDTYGDSEEVTVTIDVVNQVPTGDADQLTTDEDEELVGQLTGSDADGDNITFAAGSITPEFGTVTIDPNGSFVYTPNADQSGVDEFSFIVNDGTDNSVETVIQITINALNDAPVADVQDTSTSKNVAVSGQLTGSDIEDSELTFAEGTTPAVGGTVVINPDGTFTFTPTADFTGQGSFTFVVNDGDLDSPEVLVNVTVVDNVPTVVDGEATIDEDTVLTSTLANLGTDLDGDTLTYSVVTQPENGTISLSADGNFVYTPDEDFFGTDTFTFLTNDGTSDSTVATFTITVNPIEDEFELDLTAVPVTINRDKQPVVLDPTALVDDVDSDVDYANATVVASITAGGGKKDRLLVTDGALRVKGKKILFDNVLLAKTTGGKKGKPLQIAFTESANFEAVNAVLRQLALQTAKKSEVGARTIDIQVTADGETTSGTITANVV